MMNPKTRNRGHINSVVSSYESADAIDISFLHRNTRHHQRTHTGLLMNEDTNNGYSTYSVVFPYECSFTIPDDGNETEITIKTKSQVLRYGKGEEDIRLQMELDLEQGKETYAKHILKWVSNKLYNIDPRDVNVSYEDITSINLMSDEEIDEFREDCLNDE